MLGQSCRDLPDVDAENDCEAEIDNAIESIAQENGLSVEQLKRSVEDQGLPFEGYRQRIREEIEHTKVVSGMVGARVRMLSGQYRRIGVTWQPAT